MVMKKIKFLFEVFSKVTTCVVIAVALFHIVPDPADAMEAAVLWQILGVSFLCSLGSLIYPWDRPLGKWEMGIRIFVHYLFINGIVLAAGFWFQWYSADDLGSVMIMLFTIALIFGVVSVLSWSKAAEDAKRMNEKLREFQEKKG